MIQNSGPKLRARVLVRGNAQGVALVLDEPLSLWGGMDPMTGVVIDHRHPQAGAQLTGQILVMPSGRGSSSSSSVLAEAIRLRTAPLGIILIEPDGILMVGALVARELYGHTCPIVILDDESYRAIQMRDVVGIHARSEPATVTVDHGSMAAQ